MSGSIEEALADKWPEKKALDDWLERVGAVQTAEGKAEPLRPLSQEDRVALAETLTAIRMAQAKEAVEAFKAELRARPVAPVTSAVEIEQSRVVPDNACALIVEPAGKGGESMHMVPLFMKGGVDSNDDNAPLCVQAVLFCAQKIAEKQEGYEAPETPQEG